MKNELNANDVESVQLNIKYGENRMLSNITPAVIDIIVLKRFLKPLNKRSMNEKSIAML